LSFDTIFRSRRLTPPGSYRNFQKKARLVAIAAYRPEGARQKKSGFAVSGA
jgi:hypothetical protein